MGDTMSNTLNRGNGRGFAAQTIAQPPKAAEPEGLWETGHLKWYDPDRKYGFVRTDAGYDVLIHWRCLKRSGINARELIDDMPLAIKSQPVPGRSREATIVRFRTDSPNNMANQ